VKPWHDEGFLRQKYEVEGLSITQIAREWGVGDETIRKALLKFGIPRRPRGNPKGCLRQPDLSLSPVLSYLLGVLLGDGSVVCSNGQWQIVLAAKDEPFIDSFAGALQRIGLVAHKHRYGRLWRCSSGSKVLGEWYRSLTLEDVERMVAVHPWDFLRGFFESEGTFCIGINGDVRVGFTNARSGLLQMVQRFLEAVGYDSKVYGPYRPTKELPSHRKMAYRLWLVGPSEKKVEFVKRLNPCIKNVPRDYQKREAA